MIKAAAVWPEGILNLSLGFIAQKQEPIFSKGRWRLSIFFSKIKLGISNKNAKTATLTNNRLWLSLLASAIAPNRE